MTIELEGSSLMSENVRHSPVVVNGCIKRAIRFLGRFMKH